jgi:hypothetical protein
VWFRLAAAVVTGVLAATMSPAAANADLFDGWYNIYNLKDNDTSSPYLYLNVVGPPPQAAGAFAEVNTFDSMQDTEWKRVLVPNTGGAYAFRSAGTSNWFALSIQSNLARDGQPVLQWWYSETNPYQQWKIYKTFSGGAVQYINPATNRCLAVANAADGQISRGDRVIIWTCRDQLDQRWYMQD